jgi:hypothetical protein
MPFSGMLRRVTLVITDVSEERSASIIRGTRMDGLGILAVILVTLMMSELRPSETSVLTRSIRGNNPEDGILHSKAKLESRSYERSHSFGIFLQEMS